MTDNFREFDIGVRDFTDREVPEAVRDTRDAAALEGLKTIVNLTIVDTGRLRANWQTTVGAPAEGFIEDRKDRREAEGGNVAVSLGSAAIASAHDDPFDPIWLHNGLPYAIHVNDGSPTVTAVHMLEQTVARLRRIFN